MWRSASLAYREEELRSHPGLGLMVSKEFVLKLRRRTLNRFYQKMQEWTKGMEARWAASSRETMAILYQGPR